MLVLVAVGVAVVLVAMVLVAKVMVEWRRERRRERRNQEWTRASALLPRGSRLTGIESDGCTIVEIGPSRGDVVETDLQENRGQR